MRSRFILIAPLVMLSGCSLLSGRCLYEIRGVTAEGRFIDGGAEIATAELTESEQRDYEPDKNMSWMISGPTLKGHVVRISLEDNSAGPRAFYDFPIVGGNIPMLSNGFVRQSEGANLNGFFDLLGSGRALVVIQTDLPQRPTVVIPLSVTSKQDWSRPYCS